MLLAPSAMEVIFGDRPWCILEGDCLDVVDMLPTSSIDSIVTDPPAGISFMGKDWDDDHGSAEAWIARMTLRFRHALRVLKPGGHALVWALPRTSHWTGRVLEEAGFEIRDRIVHLFGSGFPKSMNVAKEIERHAGPADAAAWMGFGTALKPAAEDWWLVRKPPHGSIAANVLSHRTGALNIDGCRVPHAGPGDFEAHASMVAAIKARGGSMENSWANHSDLSGAADASPLGRWPAHVIVSHGPGCRRIGLRKVKAAPPWYDTDRQLSAFTGSATSAVHHSDAAGMEVVEHWRCEPGCPVQLLDDQSGESESGKSSGPRGTGGIWSDVSNTPCGPQYDDAGGASRFFTQLPFDQNVLEYEPFFYIAKPSTEERERNCEQLPAVRISGRADGSSGTNSPRAGAGRKGLRRNAHPTVKSEWLMRVLCRLITPPGGLALDLFCGSGTTGVACSAERFRFIGIELGPEYAAIARARIMGDAPLLNRVGL